MKDLGLASVRSSKMNIFPLTVMVNEFQNLLVTNDSSDDEEDEEKKGDQRTRKKEKTSEKT